MSADDLHHDWLKLIEISGPFLAVPVLKEVFPTGLEGLDGLKRKRLRQAYEEWREALETDDLQLPELHAAWVDEVLSRGLELDADRRVSVLKRADWCAANLAVDLPEHAITLAPDMAVVDELRANQPLLLIQVFTQDTDLDATRKFDGWAATPAERMVQLCRTTGCRLGLVTNGERWMLIDAPVGAVTSFASWYARIWTQEPVTLQAFVHLLGIRRFFGEEAERLPALFDRSLKYQDEVTEALGEQVRRAVEVLIQALDKADQDRHRALLRDVREPELYEAALTVMMRLVFLLAAEERGLLLLGDERYEANYAVSTLRMQLTAESDGVLERRWDAWSRLLAIFRAVFGGIEHENLRLPALGGSIFDPDRFPFLEGRGKGSNWRADMAKPLPIDNRTVLLLLRAIQQFEGRTLSYAGLDVEQVGHVYEGLLERTVKRTTEVTLELDGTRNARAPWIKVTELESATAEGVERLAELLQDRCGSSASRIRNDLAKPVDDALAGRLLAACHGDAELRDRIQRYAHLVRNDPWGYPLVYPAGSFIVTTGSDRRETGAHYTPKSLTEAIVMETLTPVVYVGPAEGRPREQWVLKSPSEILDLKVCDPAMGSGAFLVQACRWLAERLVEAWSLAETTGRVVSIDGAVLDAANGKELLPRDIDARTMIARRLIAERCLYGVDLNPLAVELAKLSIWLVTLAKGRPFGFLDHNLRSGNSLLGIHRLDQLTELSMTPTGKGQQRLFGQDIERAVHEAIELRQRLRALPIRDIRDVEAMARLDADARKKLEVPELIADAFIGEVFASGGNANALASATATLAIQAGRAIDGDSESIESVRRRTVLAFAADTPADKPMHRPFHWPLEFPEVFNRARGGFDGLVGNPPFLGGQRITGVAGTAFRDWLVNHIAEGRRGSADLVAYFFLRVWSLLRDGGGFGMLAVNTIAEGDTRQVGLEAMVNAGAVIHAAYPNEPWPGKAAVVTSRVHVHRGEWLGPKSLLGHPVAYISAFLSDQADWSPKTLKRNEGSAFQGSIVLGMGFVLSSDEALHMLQADPRNAEVIFPYLNGEDLNTDPNQQPRRWVINFWDWPEEKARKYKLPFKWIEEKVKPERMRTNDSNSTGRRRKQFWWQYGSDAKNLYHAIGRGDQFVKHPTVESASQGVCFDSVIAVTRVSKYLNAALINNNAIFTLDLFVFASKDFASLALLQSNPFVAWAWSRGGRMKHDLRFSGSDVYETFPFPSLNNEQTLYDLGERFHLQRASIMKELDLGLTKTTNLIHSPKAKSVQIEMLRKVWADIDVTVLRLYGWTDIDLNHDFHEVSYRPESDRLRFTLSESARVEVLRRLSELNRERYQEEVAQGLHDGNAARSKSTPRPKVDAAAPQPSFDFGEAAANQGLYPMAAEPHRPYASPATAILAFLTTRTGWHVKSDILGATGSPDNQWNASINELVSAGKVERQGEKRGTRYRAVGGDS
jgi:hypothetical protein